MEKKILRTDKTKEQELRTSTQFACTVLNRSVFPIACELGMRIDLQDKETLQGYVKNLSSMKEAYTETAVNGVDNPALKRVAKEVTEKQWNEVAKKYELPNPYILNQIFPDTLRYVDIKGTFVQDAKAIANNDAIKEACAIYETEQDAQKKKEIHSLCDMLNSVFNGNSQLFAGYVVITNGRFYPKEGVINYKPLYNGE
ncbi:MAG: hypothetical protein II454_00395 [Bacteroidales bacterium]|nr:hypothetical protein [Bacteroidales bacterium]